MEVVFGPGKFLHQEVDVGKDIYRSTPLGKSILTNQPNYIKIKLQAKKVRHFKVRPQNAEPFYHRIGDYELL